MKDSRNRFKLHERIRSCHFCLIASSADMCGCFAVGGRVEKFSSMVSLFNNCSPSDKPRIILRTELHRSNCRVKFYCAVPTHRPSGMYLLHCLTITQAGRNRPPPYCLFRFFSCFRLVSSLCRHPLTQVFRHAPKFLIEFH